LTWRRLFPWLTAATIVLIDRITKVSVLRFLMPGSLVPIAPGIGLTHVHNPGIAFSLFADGSALTRGILQSVILVAVGFIAWVVFRQGDRSLLSSLALGLILGGALGNLIDRILYGWVVDFIHLWARIGDRVVAWPDFNVADSAITIGAILLVVHELSSPKGRRRAPDSD